MKTIKVEVAANGCLQMLHDDAFDIAAFGPVQVTRASNVEFNNATGKWYVQSARTGRILKADCDTREGALAWEKEFYGPGGKGWAELTGGK